MYLSIDIGATKTLLACFSDSGRILRRLKFPTDHDQTRFLQDLTTHLEPFRHFQLSHITVAVPGVVSNNRPIFFGNLPWHGIDIATPLKSFFTCPITFLNDADLATIYEAHFYPTSTAIYLTFSTGIGGGIAENGQLTRSSSRFEPGHYLFPWQNRHLEWEDFASANAIRLNYNGKKVTALRSQAQFNDIAHRLSIGLAHLIRHKHPQVIIIGGPVGLIFSHFKPALITYLQTALPSTPLPKIVAAHRPTESVIYGGYYYAKHHQK